MLSKTIVIGDIHGALQALKQVLHKAGIQPLDTLIFLGDYVDGWSQSAGVISFLIELQHSYSCVFLRGNHDVYCHQWLETGKIDPNWIKNSGASTIDSYQQLPNDIRQQHLHFFQQLRNYYIDTQNRLYVHAGYTASTGVTEEKHTHMLYWDRSLWEDTLYYWQAKRPNGPARLSLYKEVFIGHTPTLFADCTFPMHLYNLWNLDTGAAYHGRLTALDADSGTFYQSDVVRWMYPQETGRNKGKSAAFPLMSLYKRQ